MRTQATFLAYDIIDRMRANRDPALKGEYNVDFGDEGTAGTIAGDDLIAWKENIANTLPAIDNAGTAEVADGSISQDGNVFTVTLRWADWDDTGASGAREPMEFSLETQLQN